MTLTSTELRDPNPIKVAVASESRSLYKVRSTPRSTLRSTQCSAVSGKLHLKLELMMVVWVLPASSLGRHSWASPVVLVLRRGTTGRVRYRGFKHSVDGERLTDCHYEGSASNGLLVVGINGLDQLTSRQEGCNL